MASRVNILFASGMELDLASLTCFWLSKAMWRNNSFRQHPFYAGIIATIIRMTPNYHRSILLAFWSHLNLKPSKSNQISIKPYSSNLSIANFLVLWSSKSSVGCANMGNATTQLWSYWWGITSKIRISPGDHRALDSLFIRYSCAKWLVGVWHVGVKRFLSPGPLAYRNDFEWIWHGIFTGFNHCYRWRSFQSISIS